MGGRVTILETYLKSEEIISFYPQFSHRTSKCTQLLHMSDALSILDTFFYNTEHIKVLIIILNLKLTLQKENKIMVLK